MKKAIIKSLIIFCVAFGFMASAANAYYCRWVPAHRDAHGYWVPAQKQCWRDGYNRHKYKHCRWERNRYGYGHHKVCW